ncbi:MAG: flagellar motor switch protein FliG, partial [Oscillospiraceae bacterium]|jgi:flagellar motor switch protein FliG|nr:flagellar motor switch protein FliG [Oscillospiraceae bacterium]
VECIYENVSQRAKEDIEEEISYMNKVRLSDVEAAQQRIVQIIRDLVRAGEVTVDKSGKDEVIV